MQTSSELMLEGLEVPAGPIRRASARMVRHLEETKRITVDHEPLVQLLLKLAESLEHSGGRGASVALLSAQFQQTWAMLASLPAPVDEAAVEYDVVLLPIALPDAS